MSSVVPVSANGVTSNAAIVTANGGSSAAVSASTAPPTAAASAPGAAVGAAPPAPAPAAALPAKRPSFLKRLGSKDKPSAAKPAAVALEVRELSTGAAQALAINSAEPIPFENELFKGRILLRVRTHPVEPTVTEFFKKHPKTRFNVSVQGKFKRRNVGKIYLGTELPGPMKMSSLKKTIANLVLIIGHSINPRMHYSLADKGKDELAHVVGPVTVSAERCIETKPGQVPPLFTVNDLFPSNVAMDFKTADPAFTFDPECTYSFSVSGGSMDWPKWKLCGLPGISEMDLQGFFGTNPLHLVMYELAKDEVEETAPEAPLPGLTPVRGSSTDSTASAGSLQSVSSVGSSNANSDDGKAEADAATEEVIESELVDVPEEKSTADPDEPTDEPSDAALASSSSDASTTATAAAAAAPASVTDPVVATAIKSKSKGPPPQPRIYHTIPHKRYLLRVEVFHTKHCKVQPPFPPPPGAAPTSSQSAAVASATTTTTTPAK